MGHTDPSQIRAPRKRLSSFSRDASRRAGFATRSAWLGAVGQDSAQSPPAEDGFGTAVSTGATGASFAPMVLSDSSSGPSS